MSVASRQREYLRKVAAVADRLENNRIKLEPYFNAPLARADREVVESEFAFGRIPSGVGSDTFVQGVRLEDIPLRSPDLP